jgi:hypothetical protein
MCFGRMISLDPGRHDGEGGYQGFSDRNATYFAVDDLTRDLEPGGTDDEDGDAGDEDADAG